MTLKVDLPSLYIFSLICLVKKYHKSTSLIIIENHQKVWGTQWRKNQVCTTAL